MNNETKPLIGGNNARASADADAASDPADRFASWFSNVKGYAMVLLVAIAAIIYFVSNYASDDTTILRNRGNGPFDGPPSSSSASSSSLNSDINANASPFMYRPFCLTHSSPTARILQTSMGQPSQQWSHIPCYAQTSAGRLWAARKASDPHLNQFGASDAIFNVSLSRSPFANKTPIIGFGAAFTNAAALNFATLSEKGKTTFLQLMFGKSGLGYTLGRVPLNSCDFSIKSYSFDDTDGDFELKDFDTQVQYDQDIGTLDMVRRAAAVLNSSWTSEDGADGILNMYTSPWSPPAWMKAPTPDDKAGASHAHSMTSSHQGSCLREGTGPDSRYAKSWALYFSKFISAYKSLGVSFWAVTVQNEPEFAAPWEACSYTPVTQRDFVAYHLGPQLQKDHPDVKIFMFDHNKDHAATWAKVIMDKTHEAAKYVNGTAIHWYAGGMDRLLDGAVGAPHMHHFQSKLDALQVPNDHIVLGSEACHCPSTGYAGGDIEIYWARAERYAHSILSDLAAGSQAWVEWNLLLDSMGGPNHLGNLCDSTVLAVPHRAINGSNIPPVMEWEHDSQKFSPNVGDGRTRAELNALGFPAKHLDDGLAVQPMYYYMGQISRYVRPGSRAVMGIVSESKTAEGESFRAFRSPGQVVAGGGMNDLARIGIELTVWPCEGSTRQQFTLNEASQIQVFGHDWLGKPTTSCLGVKNSRDFDGITLTSCDKGYGVFDRIPSSSGKEGFVQFELKNSAKAHRQCLMISPLGNNGGAYGPRGGAHVVYGNCSTPASDWLMNDDNGEIRSVLLEEGEVCMTTGWPFLQIGAFDTPNGESDKTVIVLNEARDSANYVLYDGNVPLLSGSIPPRAIQTVLVDDA